MFNIDDDYSAVIMIDNSSLASFKKYIEKLEKAGWSVLTTYGDEDSVVLLGHLMEYKEDGWWMGIDISENASSVSMIILPPSDGSESGDSGGGGDSATTGGDTATTGGDSGGGSTTLAEGWPAADVPKGFPAYPNGVVDEIAGELADPYIGLLTRISGTDQATADAYKKLVGEWEASEKDYWTNVYFEKPDSVNINVGK
jgi:hypothetical protein